jgi:fibronectin-binding autotransporter adhesin
VRLTPNAEAVYSVKSITFDSGASSFTLSGSSLTIGSSGITQSSANVQTINNAITLGAAQTWSATSGNLAFGGNVTNGGFLLTIGGAFNTSLSGALTGSGGLTKSGTGTFTFSGADSISGTLTVSGGMLILSGSGSNGSGATAISGATSVLSLRGTASLGTGNLSFTGGVLELGNADFTRSLGTGAGQVNLSGTGGGGFAAYGSDRILNFGGSGATVTWGAGSFIASGQPLLLGSTTSNATVDFQNGLNLGSAAAQTVKVARGTGSGPDAKISGVISGSVAFQLDANGTTGGRLLLTNGNNSYTNGTNIFGGELWLGANATSGAGNTVLGNSASAVFLGNVTGAVDASLFAAAAISVSRNITLLSGGTGVLSIGGVTADASTFSGTITLGSTTAGRNLTLSAVGGGTVTFSGLIKDPASVASKGVVTKAGSGIVNLTTANTYGGGTTISAGSLFANNSSGSATGTGSIAVNNSGSTFGGSGIVTGAVTVGSGANIAPGASGVGSTAILRTGALTLSSGSNFNVDLNNTTAGTGYDQLSVTGAVNLGGLLASNLSVTAGSSLTIGQKYFILLNDGSDAITGTFAQGTNITASNNGDTFLINYADNGDGGTLGNDISLTVVAVPEPSTYITGALALAALLYNPRRRILRMRVIR